MGKHLPFSLSLFRAAGLAQSFAVEGNDTEVIAAVGSGDGTVIQSDVSSSSLSAMCVCGDGVFSSPNKRLKQSVSS